MDTALSQTRMMKRMSEDWIRDVGREQTQGVAGLLMIR